MRTFEHFPKEAICPICKENNDSECVLIPIDGTEKGNICEAQPVHVKCLCDNKFRYNKSINVIYMQLPL